MPSLRRAPAFAALLAVVAAPAGAQRQALAGCEPDGPTPAMLSAANEVYYGCGYLFRSTTPQWFSAIGYFQNAVRMEPDNAVARFLLGAALAGYGQADSARVVLRRALELDPEVVRTLAPRFAERPEVRARADAVLGGQAAAQGAAPVATPAPTTAAPPAPVPAAAPRPAAAFRVGEVVDVRSSGTDWERGTVVAVEDERGDGSWYLYQVRRELVPGDPTTASVSRVYPAGIRVARGPLTAAPVAARSAALAYGAYACTHDSWTGPPSARQRKSDPKGALHVRPDGTYRYLDNGDTGRYRYDEATRAIRWLTGPLATMRPERTTFRRNVKTAQIDIRMTGVYEWSCGVDLP